jgi:serine/threonine-protein kinase
MTVRLVITAGPHAGKEFAFDRHDTFLVGRSKDAHLQLSADDPYFSRRHFLFEVNPPRVRVIDLNSRNGTRVNGQRITVAELTDGQEITAGHTVFRIAIPPPPPDEVRTLDLPPTGPTDADTRHRPPDADSASASALLPSSAAPESVPGYRLVSELGRGGMGAVYRAVRTADGVPVAVKTILPSPGVSPRQVEKFLREARILAALDHPHIVTHLDSGLAGGAVFLVMELIDGTDAKRLVQARGPLGVSAAVKLACAVLSALGHAHDAGIVHRDVKPANVLVGGAGGRRTAKLADFGLARAYDECKLSGLTFQGEVGGTPAFMAPEQVTHFREVKPAADQYAAAATLYHLLTGAYTHDLARDVGGQFAQIVSESPVPIRDRRPDLPPALAAAVHRALEQSPADRYPDVLAFRRALLPFTR